MNLREAKRELIEHGYEIHQLNEGCYGGGGCGQGGWSDSYYSSPRAPYRKDSELSDEELKARNELRAKKAKNKEIKAKIESILQEYAEKLEKKYNTYTQVTANKGTVVVKLGHNIRINMTKSINNQTYFDLGTNNGWGVSSREILEFIEKGDEIKKLMADFRKFNINI